jgi:hypothetical protein
MTCRIRLYAQQQRKIRGTIDDPRPARSEPTQEAQWRFIRLPELPEIQDQPRPWLAAGALELRKPFGL